MPTARVGCSAAEYPSKGCETEPECGRELRRATIAVTPEKKKEKEKEKKRRVFFLFHRGEKEEHVREIDKTEEGGQSRYEAWYEAKATSARGLFLVP